MAPVAVEDHAFNVMVQEKQEAMDVSNLTANLLAPTANFVRRPSRFSEVWSARCGTARDSRVAKATSAPRCRWLRRRTFPSQSLESRLGMITGKLVVVNVKEHMANLGDVCTCGWAKVYAKSPDRPEYDKRRDRIAARCMKYGNADRIRAWEGKLSKHGKKML